MYAAKAAAASLTPGGSPGNTYHCLIPLYGWQSLVCSKNAFDYLSAD